MTRDAIRHKWFALYENDGDEDNPHPDIVEAMGIGDHTLVRVTQWDALEEVWRVSTHIIPEPIEKTASRPLPPQEQLDPNDFPDIRPHAQMMRDGGWSYGEGTLKGCWYRDNYDGATTDTVTDSSARVLYEAGARFDGGWQLVTDGMQHVNPSTTSEALDWLAEQMEETDNTPPLHKKMLAWGWTRFRAQCTSRPMAKANPHGYDGWVIDGKEGPVPDECARWAINEGWQWERARECWWQPEGYPTGDKWADAGALIKLWTDHKGWTEERD